MRGSRGWLRGKRENVQAEETMHAKAMGLEKLKFSQEEKGLQMTHVMLWRSSLPGLRQLGQTPPARCIWVAMVFIIKSFLKSTLRLLPPCSLSVIFFCDTALALVYPLFSPHKLFSSAINFVANFMKSSLNSIYRNLVPGDMPESQINLKSLVCTVMDSLYMEHC